MGQVGVQSAISMSPEPGAGQCAAKAMTEWETWVLLPVATFASGRRGLVRSQ